MLMGLVSFMTGNERTTGSKMTSTSYKKKLALDSLSFNLANEKFMKSFGNFLLLLFDNERVRFSTFEDQCPRFREKKA